MEELEVFQKFDEIAVVTQYGDLFGGDKEKAKQIAAHILSGVSGKFFSDHSGISSG